MKKLIIMEIRKKLSNSRSSVVNPEAKNLKNETEKL